MALECNHTDMIQPSHEYHKYENETIQNIIVVLELVIHSNTQKRIAEKILDTHFYTKKSPS